MYRRLTRDAINLSLGILLGRARAAIRKPVHGVFARSVLCERQQGRIGLQATCVRRGSARPVKECNVAEDEASGGSKSALISIVRVRTHDKVPSVRRWGPRIRFLTQLQAFRIASTANGSAPGLRGWCPTNPGADFESDMPRVVVKPDLSGCFGFISPASWASWWFNTSHVDAGTITHHWQSPGYFSRRFRQQLQAMSGSSSLVWCLAVGDRRRP
ncbi:hypothetical protein B0H13DRAFT_1860538 [Mycena leptocephala]|nr:hypothetical protein B0H13DRAFT_1860538 [Mycena leptocephala]